MARIIYVNGRYSSYSQASIHVEDRGFQFADGVYEVCFIHDRKIVDLDGHLERLERSLGELRMAPPMSRSALIHVMNETLRRNKICNGYTYLQVTRGSAPRAFSFPADGIDSSLICMARTHDEKKNNARAKKGICALTVPDIRWARRDIKSISLLPQMLASQTALDQGCAEALLVEEDGFITEGSHSNAWMVDHDNRLLTRRADNSILRGRTREAVAATIDELGLKFEERAFSVDEVLAAKEVFVTSTTALLMPVVQIDGKQIGNGVPGDISHKLRQLICDAYGM